MSNCSDCGSPLTEKEKYYYGGTCNNCEEKYLIAMQEDLEVYSMPSYSELRADCKAMAELACCIAHDHPLLPPNMMPAHNVDLTLADIRAKLNLAAKYLDEAKRDG